MWTKYCSTLYMGRTKLRNFSEFYSFCNYLKYSQMKTSRNVTFDRMISLTLSFIKGVNTGHVIVLCSWVVFLVFVTFVILFICFFFLLNSVDIIRYFYLVIFFFTLWDFFLSNTLKSSEITPGSWLNKFKG